MVRAFVMEGSGICTPLIVLKRNLFSVEVCILDTLCTVQANNLTESAAARVANLLQA